MQQHSGKSSKGFFHIFSCLPREIIFKTLLDLANNFCVPLVILLSRQLTSFIKGSDPDGHFDFVSHHGASFFWGKVTK
jgi:hypothetical protein